MSNPEQQFNSQTSMKNKAEETKEPTKETKEKIILTPEQAAAKQGMIERLSKGEFDPAFQIKELKEKLILSEPAFQEVLQLLTQDEN